MPRVFCFLMLSGLIGASLAAANAQPDVSHPTAVGPPGSMTKPAAPAIKPGMFVHDRSGLRVGVVETVTETPGGLNVVAKIDGKLVGLAASTLKLRDDLVVSGQTKQEMLATAGAQP